MRAAFHLLVLIAGVFSMTTAVQAHYPAATPATPKWSLAIHGGSGTIERANLTAEQDRDIRAALDRALAAGSKVLSRGGTALDAVEAAIMVLEDDPHFNAGKGAVFTADGENRMDSSIMRGDTREAGAVAGISATKNPITAARAVMERSPHVMLAGEGADRFSREQGLEQAPPEYFATEFRREALERMKASKTSSYDIDLKYGTVGAVGRDSGGHVAAGTSTGGMTGKRWDRIGDSPIIGAGTYADDRACAVSATGSGEYFIRLGVAHEICARMRFTGEGAQAAASHVIAELGALGGNGGVIVAAPDGTTALVFNTPGMYRARADANGLKEVAIYGDE